MSNQSAQSVSAQAHLKVHRMVESAVMLAIAALGYAGVWMDGQSRMDGNDERIAALLRVPAGMTVHSLIPFGVPEQQPRQAPKKPFAERAVYDHF